MLSLARKSYKQTNIPTKTRRKTTTTEREQKTADGNQLIEHNPFSIISLPHTQGNPHFIVIILSLLVTFICIYAIN